MKKTKYKKLKESFPVSRFTGMAVFYDWVERFFDLNEKLLKRENYAYLSDIDGDYEQLYSYYSNIEGFIWAMCTFGQITDEFRNSLINEFIKALQDC